MERENAISWDQEREWKVKHSRTGLAGILLIVHHVTPDKTSRWTCSMSPLTLGMGKKYKLTVLNAYGAHSFTYGLPRIPSQEYSPTNAPLRMLLLDAPPRMLLHECSSTNKVDAGAFSLPQGLLR